MDSKTLSILIQFLVDSISIAAMFIYGCVGETLIEKTGHLNLGIPGIMCMGAAGGIVGVMIGGVEGGVFSVILSVVFAMLFASIGGLIYAFFTVTFRCNQNVTGLALSIFGNGFCTVIIKLVKKSSVTSAIGALFNKGLPFAESMGIFGRLIFSHGFLVYLAIIIAIVASVVMRFTRIGLNIRSIGESPATADAAGINVTMYKYSIILIGSAIAGIGGVFYPMHFMNGMFGGEFALKVEEIGWLCVALVIFSLWKPALSIGGSIFFGLLYSISSSFTALTGVSLSESMKEILNAIPYVSTIVVLVVTSMFGKKENMGPGSLGVSYFREDR